MKMNDNGQFCFSSQKSVSLIEVSPLRGFVDAGRELILKTFNPSGVTLFVVLAPEEPNVY